MENVFLTDIYPAGEKPIEGVSSEKLAMESGAEYLGSLETACRKISKVLKENDVFVSMGAGDVTKAYDYISEFLTASCSN
jgi:UDP-N-acetylmuramate--alanine ligase